MHAKLLAAGLQLLASLPSLYLACNATGNVGMCKLAQALSAASALRSLELVCNVIGDGGMVALGATMRSMPLLSWLLALNNPMGDESLRAFARGAVHIRQSHKHAVFVVCGTAGRADNLVVGMPAVQASAAGIASANLRMTDMCARLSAKRVDPEETSCARAHCAHVCVLAAMAAWAQC